MKHLPSWGDLSTALVVILIIIALYFAGKKMLYCLEKTGQLDCTVIAGTY